MGFSRQEYWSSLPFPSPVYHVFSEFSTTSILLGWPSMAWLIALSSYTRLWSICSFWLAFCDCGFHSGGCRIVVLASSLCPLMYEMRIRGFCHLQNFSVACSRTVEYNDQETHGPVHKAVVLPGSQRGISKCWLHFYSVKEHEEGRVRDVGKKWSNCARWWNRWRRSTFIHSSAIMPYSLLVILSLLLFTHPTKVCTGPHQWEVISTSSDFLNIKITQVIT